jgi:hypothetical protein
MRATLLVSQGNAAAGSSARQSFCFFIGTATQTRCVGLRDWVLPASVPYITTPPRLLSFSDALVEKGMVCPGSLPREILHLYCQTTRNLPVIRLPDYDPGVAMSGGQSLSDRSAAEQPCTEDPLDPDPAAYMYWISWPKYDVILRLTAMSVVETSQRTRESSIVDLEQHKFHPDYKKFKTGDIILKSSDGISFCYSFNLLTHLSSFVRDLATIPAEADSGMISSSRDVLIISLPSANYPAIYLALKTIDSVIAPDSKPLVLPSDIDTIGDTLKMADAYDLLIVSR